MSAMIEINNLAKSFGKVDAVKNLTLSVEKGTIFSFLGPNGAGKSTTIRMLCGILEPDAGTIIVSGINLAKNPVLVKSRIGYIPDDPFVYRYLTGREFLRFMATVYGLTEHQASARIKELLQMFPTIDDIDAPFYTYSRGTRQKLVFIAAMMHKPDLFVIDEPMVGLDPRSALAVKMMLQQEVKERGATVFLSTHTLSVAEEICDTVAILDHGRLVAQGTLAELRTKTHKEHASLESIFLGLT